MQDERWVLMGFTNNKYEISDYGFIRNVKTQKRLKCSSSGDKYQRFSYKDKKIRVHRLVAKYFLPNPNNFPSVRHLDSSTHGKLNNHVSNLMWCDPYLLSLNRRNVVKRIEGHYTPIIYFKGRRYNIGRFCCQRAAGDSGYVVRKLISDLYTHFKYPKHTDDEPAPTD